MWAGTVALEPLGARVTIRADTIADRKALHCVRSPERLAAQARESNATMRSPKLKGAVRQSDGLVRLELGEIPKS